MKAKDFVVEKATVTGTTNPFVLGGQLTDSNQRFRNAYPDGTTDLAIVAATMDGSPNGAKMEVMRMCTLTYVAGSPPPDTLSRGVVIKSKTVAGLTTNPINWLASDVIIVYQAVLADILHTILQPQFMLAPAGDLVINPGNAWTYFGQFIEMDVTAGNRALVLPLGALVGHGYRFDAYPFGNVANNITITPAATQGINDLAIGASYTLPCGTAATVRWNDVRSKWMIK